MQSNNASMAWHPADKRLLPPAFANVPAVLAIRRPDPVIIIDFAIMNSSKKTTVNQRFRGQELAGKAAFKTNADLDSGLLDRLLHR